MTAVSEQTIGSIISTPLPDKELPKGSEASEDLAADFLIRLAAKDGREAIKKAWPQVGKAILQAVKSEGKNHDPGSSEVKDALNRLERSGRYPEGVIRKAQKLWRKAHMVFYQSPYAYDPQSKEAEEFILDAAAAYPNLQY